MLRKGDIHSCIASIDDVSASNQGIDSNGQTLSQSFRGIVMVIVDGTWLQEPGKVLETWQPQIESRRSALRCKVNLGTC